MFKIGVRLTVLLAGILGFLALTSGHNVTASPVLINGPWASVYSTDTQENAGDCQGGFSGPDSALTDGGDLWDCRNSAGVLIRTGGALSASLTGLSITGSVAFTGPSVAFAVDFEGTLSPDGKSMTGTWAYDPTLFGTFRAALQTNTTGTPGQTVSAPYAGSDGASLTFGGTTTGGNTAIISSPTSGGALPPHFDLIGQYYHVVTDNTTGPPGPYIFCAGYHETPAGSGLVGPGGIAEASLKIWHLETGNVWNEEDRYNEGGVQPASNTDDNIVCASVTHLSEFALVGPGDPVGGVVSIATGDSSSGANIWLWGMTITVAAIALATAAGWIGMRRRGLD